MIRKLTKDDKELYMYFTELFYNSDAVLHPVPEKNRENTFNELMRSEDYAQCYILEYENKPVGFALLAKTFSQEVGGIVIWIEELYVLDEYRGRGLGKEFFSFVEENIPNSRLRLEIEPDNQRAKKLYESLGFRVLDYKQMVKDK